MKIGEIKHKIKADAQLLFKDERDKENYLRNLDSILNFAFGENDQREYDKRFGHKTRAKFQYKLKSPIPGKSFARVPKHSIKDLLRIFEKHLPYPPEQRQLCQEAHYISEGNPYGPRLQWCLLRARSLTLRPPPDQQDETKHDGCVKALERVHIITDKDSQNTAYAHIQAGLNPLVMNAGNRYHILGSFEWNDGTQEESLGFTTNLSKHLYPWGKKNEKDGRYYYNNPLSHPQENGNRLIYAKGVWFFKRANSVADTLKHHYKEQEPFSCDVATIAGFDLRKGKKSDRQLFEKKQGGFNWEYFRESTEVKFNDFFNEALKQGNQSVVVCPLSCGAF